MKFIKQHVSLIFPLIAILLGLEFFIVFDRTTDSFEKSLKDNYSMVVIAKKEMSIDDFKAWDDRIEEVREKKYTKLLQSIEFDEGLESSLPFAYSLKLNEYLTLSKLDEVKENLQKSGNFKSIESFHSSYQSKYELFSFIKLAFQTFIIFMSIIGFFLIIKQMEVWNFLHADRMKIMEIFGASLFLRSKILINMALIDAIISAVITSAIFYAIQNFWIKGSQMAILKENVDAMFSYADIFILLFAAIFVVMVA
ncbi:MAG TPA: cell division protein FtsX, partial [Campylobacterales bacterium]|nr:cell division protein FtsX [Campylobacterales bacterium]